MFSLHHSRFCTGNTELHESSSAHLDTARVTYRGSRTRGTSRRPTLNTVNCNETTTKMPDIRKRSKVRCRGRMADGLSGSDGRAKLRLAAPSFVKPSASCDAQIEKWSVVLARESYRSFVGVALAVVFFAVRRRDDARTTSCGCNTTISGLVGTFECRIASAIRAACSPICRLC